MEFKSKDFFDLNNPIISKLFDPNGLPWGPLKQDLEENKNENLKTYLKALIPESVILGEVSEKAHLEGDHIYIAEGASVEAGAYIRGPVYIGENTQVRHGAYIRGNVLVGKNCVIGHSTEVKHSIFFDGAKAGHFNYIGDSVLGNNVNLGAGTKLANLKITSGNVFLKTNDGKIDSGLRKFGAILGDNSQTGCNSVLNPGTVLAKKSLVLACVSAHGAFLKPTIIK